MATALHSTRTRFFDKCGKPLCGGSVYTYQVGTTTDKITYTDVSKTAVNTNPVILDSVGSAAIFLDGAYRVRVLDRNGVLVEDIAYIESWISATEKDKIYEAIDGIDEVLTAHSQNYNNPHRVTKTQIGLGNVDNTADTDKPVSNAAKAYIDQQDALKADSATTYSKSEVDSKVNAVSGGYIGAFATLSELNAKTGMTTGQVAKVMNDTTTANNGDYRYSGTAWEKGYDALTDAKSYTDAKLAKNSVTRNYDKTAFSLNRAYQNNGSYSVWSGWYATDYIAVKAGDVIDITTVIDASGYPWILAYDTNKTFIERINTTVNTTSQQTFKYTVKQDGYIITQHSSTTLDTFLVINAGKVVFLTPDNLASNVTFATKADAISKIPYTNFELGWVDNGGVQQASTSRARSRVYKLDAGTVINITNLASDKYYFGYNTSATSTVVHNDGLWYAEKSKTITISLAKPYIQFFIRRTDGSNLDIDAALQVMSFTNDSPAVYGRDLVAINKKIGSLGITDFNSMFRTPSRATGGVITIIDDDGRSQTYNDLYPFLKSNDIPLGIAVVPTFIGTTGYMTIDDVKNADNDFKYLEFLNHTYEHKPLANLGTLTDEQKHYQIYMAKKWCVENGIETQGFVLPNGDDNGVAQRIVQMYYNSCYDYASDAINTHDTIKNYLITRTNFGFNADVVDVHKALIDQAVAQNGWLVITTHYGNQYYWDNTANMNARLQQIIDYAKSKNVKFLRPSEGFQTFGNMLENDSGFRITATGKTLTV